MKPVPKPKARPRRLLDLAKTERMRLIMGTVFLFIGSGMTLAYPQVIRVIIDQAQNPERDNAGVLLDQAALLMLVIFIIQGVATAARYHLFTYAGERIVSRLRQELYGNIIAQEMGFFDATNTGEFLSRLSNDTQTIRSTVSINVSMALRGVATVVGGLTLLIYTSPSLSLVMLSSVPVAAVGAAVVSRFIRRFARRYSDALADAAHIAEETLGGMRTVRAFSRESKESTRYNTAIDSALGVARKRINIVSAFQGIMAVVAYSSLGLVLWFGGHLMLEGKMSAGELTQFVLYTATVALSLSMLTGLYADFMRAAGASERVFELLDRSPQIPLEGGLEITGLHGEIQFSNIGFSYPVRPDIQVLKAMSFTIKAGERIALVGPSGGGKSTIAALLIRYYDPDSGHISIDDHRLNTLNANSWHKQLGVVAQEPLLFSTTVAENIGYALDAPSALSIEQAAKDANAHEFISTFPEGYQTRVGERGVMLSGGQKQRVAIARALLANPSVLILDEATSALDAQSEHLVQEALERLMVGRTTLVIAHRLSTVVNADRVLVIEEGRLVQEGSHGALMQEAEGLYRKLIERQFVSAI